MELKDIFGKPNEGFHKTRILGFAAFDILFMLVIGFIIAKYTDKSVLKITTMLFFFGQLLHFVLGVDTAFMKLLDSSIC